MHLRWRLCEKTIFTLGAWNPRKRRVVTIRTTCTLEKLFKKVFVIERGNEEKDLLNKRCLSGSTGCRLHHAVTKATQISRNELSLWRYNIMKIKYFSWIGLNVVLTEWSQSRRRCCKRRLITLSPGKFHQSPTHLTIIATDITTFIISTTILTTIAINQMWISVQSSIFVSISKKKV